MARSKSHKRAKKEEARKAMATGRALPSRLPNRSSAPSHVHTSTHTRADLLLPTGQPKRGDKANNLLGAASDSTTMASQDKLPRQLSVEVAVRAGGNHLAEGSADDSMTRARDDHTRAPAPAEPVKKGGSLLGTFCESLKGAHALALGGAAVLTTAAVMGLVVLPLAGVLTALDLTTSGSSSQPADSVYTYVEACVITSEEAYSCEEPEETIVLLAKARTAPAELLTGLSSDALVNGALSGASSA